MRKTNQTTILMSFTLLAMLILTGCSGNITRTDSSNISTNIVENTKLSNIEVSMIEAMQDKLDKNNTFDVSMLEKSIENKLINASLKEENSKYILNIIINDVRVRSTFNAVMWGFMSGDDHIKGKATIVDNDGTIVNEFNVNASYALGGFAGGQDSSRMSWLYEKFAELIVEGIQGKQKEA